MNIYRFSFAIEADLEAENLDEAWESIKQRMDDRFWGPTAVNIVLTGKTEESAEEVA